MANFLLAGGEQGFSAINMDQIRVVKRDKTGGKVTIIFARDHSIELEGAMAKQSLDVLTRLNSEVSQAWQTAKKDY